MTDEAGMTPEPVRRRSWVGTAVALTLVVAGIVSAIVITQRRHMIDEGAKAIVERSSRRAEDLPVLGTVEDFSLTDQDGNTVTLGSLLGRVWIAEFFFTYCGGPCTRMNKNFAALHREFVGEEEPRFVSITADPQRDTFDALADHARMLQADTKRWWFLRGESRELYDLSQSLLLPFEIGNPASHSTRFVLVDREGQIRGAYTGDKKDRAELDDLRRDLRALLAAPANE